MPANLAFPLGFGNSLTADQAAAVAPVVLAAGTAAASANTAAIQAALNAGGLVQILGVAGTTYYINSTLKIGSNTELRIAPGVIIKLTAGANCNMLVNQAYVSTPTAVTVTWSSGLIASVAWAAHGKSVGDYISLTGATGATAPAFTDVFYVKSITDANNLTIALVETPTGIPAGTIVARAADKNITIRGGIWDYDVANQTTAIGLARNTMNFAHVQEVDIEEVEYFNPMYDCMEFAAARDSHISGLHLRQSALGNNAQILKLNGPLHTVVVEFVDGYTQDDLVSLQPQETAAYAAYDIGGGSVRNVHIRNIGGSSLYSAHAVAIYLTPSGKYWSMQNVTVDGIDCTGSTSATVPPVGVFGDSSGADYSSVADSITFRNISFATPTGQNVFVVDRYAYIKRLSLDGFTINTAGETTSYDAIKIAGKVDTLDVVRSYGRSLQSFVTTTTPAVINNLTVSGTFDRVVGAVAPNGGTVNVINLRDSEIVGNGFSQCGVLGIGATTVGTINLDGVHMDSATGQAVNTVTASLSNPQVNLTNCQFDNSAIVYTNSPLRAHVTGCRFLNASLGILRNESGTSALRLSSGGGNTLTAGVWVTVQAGTPVISVYGWDIAVAPNATGIARTAGSYCFNNAAAVGTLVQNNVCVCDATGAANSWKQLSNTTLTY